MAEEDLDDIRLRLQTILSVMTTLLLLFEKVGSGMYTSASEVIRESLRLLHTHDDLQTQRINQLNQAFEVGLQQLNSGKKIPARDS